MVWLISAGLVICLAMIGGLLTLVVCQGMATFWPAPLVRIETVGGETLMGEFTRSDTYELTYAALSTLDDSSAKQARRLLLPRLYQSVTSWSNRDSPEPFDEETWSLIVRSVVTSIRDALDTGDAPLPEDRALVTFVEQELRQHRSQYARHARRSLQSLTSPQALDRSWQQWQATQQEWLELGDSELMLDLLSEDKNLLRAIVASHVLRHQSDQVHIRVRRSLLRIGNYEFTNEHFRWLSEFEIARNGKQYPQWALLLERRAWGRFYGIPARFKIDGKDVATTEPEIWKAFQQHHTEVRRRWQARRRLEKRKIGQINHQLEQSRLRLKRIAMRYGKESEAWRQAERIEADRQQRLESEFARIRKEIDRLQQENARYEMELRMADGETATIRLSDIVRAYPPNQLSWWGRLGIYASRWWEFLSDEPREANTEGGIFPAIWGTVVMTLLMSLAVIPLGVLAALYLREYAKSGWIVSIIRISVNNLAGVPSIVFGVFGLGFFCYIVGASLDQLLFAEKLPNPTFGTGGLLWASLTLALLTVPVVIVSTEEALAAVPRSMREGSLACGATRWQTIRRIVLPRALPGIMTGVILSMARGAGEVAPLMLVGAVKLAPELPLDTTFPFAHLQRSFMHLGFHIYDLGFQSQNSEAAKPMVYTTTLLLITLVATMNLLAIWLRARLKKRFDFSRL